MLLWAGTICMFFPLRDAAAQSAHRKVSDSLTTRSGVYTSPQAGRGRDVYMGNCRNCHTPETHTGATFKTVWNKRSLADLYAFVRERMPKNDPGTLSDEEYADVVAYLLRMNKMPAGKRELAPDSAALAKIRIKLP
ncbi:MAG TPA: cytochrome c [Gemmatimonadaceae bacterium]|nr:cytochrome c [Gemmatimonadaceae bacterium]